MYSIFCVGIVSTTSRACLPTDITFAETLAHQVFYYLSLPAIPICSIHQVHLRTEHARDWILVSILFLMFINRLVLFIILLYV